MSFFGKLFGPNNPSPSANPFAVPVSSSSSSSSSSSPASFPQPHFIGQPADAAGSSLSSSSSARWESIGLTSQSPSNPFRDDAAADATAPPSPRTYFSLVTHGGKLYSFGGFDDAKGRKVDLRSYDFDSKTWQLIVGTGEVPKPLYLHSAVVWDNQMWVFGGSIGKDSNDLYAFHFASRVWRKMLPAASATGATAVPSPRYGHAAVVHGDYMLVCGGCRQSNIYHSDAFVYSMRTNIWRRIADIPVDIAYHSLVAYGGKVLLINGYNGVKFNSQVFTYDMLPLSQPFLGNSPSTPWVPFPTSAKASSSFSSAGTRQPAASCGSAVVIANDWLFLFAGYTSAGHANDTYKLDLRSGEWEVVDTPIGSRPVSRAYLQAALNQTDGYLYIFYRSPFNGSKRYRCSSISTGLHKLRCESRERWLQLQL